MLELLWCLLWMEFSLDTHFFLQLYLSFLPFMPPCPFRSGASLSLKKYINIYFVGALSTTPNLNHHPVDLFLIIFLCSEPTISILDDSVDLVFYPIFYLQTAIILQWSIRPAGIPKLILQAKNEIRCRNPEVEVSSYRRSLDVQYTLPSNQTSSASEPFRLRKLLL